MKLSKTLQKSYTVEDLLDYANGLSVLAARLAEDDAADETEVEEANEAADAAVGFIAGLAFNGNTGTVIRIMSAAKAAN